MPWKTIPTIVGEAAGAWLDWVGNLLSAISQAIPAIMSLVQAKKAEATANLEAAGAGAASSVASIPYVGPIMAVAAVASVIAAMANIPKFAGGGVVYEKRRNRSTASRWISRPSVRR